MVEHNFKWKNNGRTKVMIGCGTRPEIIRLAAVIKRCREYFDCCVVYYNQNWDRNLSTVFWEDFDLRNEKGELGPDILVHVVGENLGVTCGNILGRSYELLSKLQPDGYLVLGDTNSCLSAISAKRLHIPLFHMEAGNRCKDECLPEETNRRIVDVISDVNLCYSEFARKYLADTGLPKERTYMTGSPMAEVLRGNLEKIEKSDVLDRLGLEPNKYILLSAHREENIDTEKNFTSLFTAINALAEKYDMPILYSCHPRSKNRLEKSGFKLDPRVRVNIDDLVEGMFDLLEGKERHCGFDGVENVPDPDGRYCCVPVTHKVTLGEIVDLLEEFKNQPISLMMPKCPEGSFAKKLFSLYLTYLPAEKFKYAMKMNCDDRGGFTELVHTVDCGQVSINISKPGITKGQHWHNSKWEQFIVVHGHGLIQERNINTGETVEFEVSGDKIEAIYMIPGWTHNIINLSDTDDLVTVMTCNEIFDPGHPDTFFEKV